jgi:2,3-bisphosphoglycerate-dependent phosphoglycerate mutase
MRYLIAFLTSILFISCSNTLYIVRHAEKETGIDATTMQHFTDPPLSYEGEQRALALKQVLESRNIRHIYSTNTARTLGTAAPIREMHLGMRINLYSAGTDSFKLFINEVKNIRRGDVLIVGHTNTVGETVNALCGKTLVKEDLQDYEYDNLFVLKRKGNSYEFKREKYGAPSKKP